MGRTIAGLLLLLRMLVLLPLAVLSESESEETTKGSNKFDLAWLAEKGSSACEVCERDCTGEDWRVLLRRPCEGGLRIDGESLLQEYLRYK